MRNTEKYAGKRVLVVGMARSGVAAAKLLHKAGAKVIINDNKTAEQLGDALLPLSVLFMLAVLYRSDGTVAIAAAILCTPILAALRRVRK